MQPATAVKNSPEIAPANFWTWLDRHEGRIAFAMALVYVLVFGSLSLVRHWAFHSTALDLGVFDQVLWNTIHGRFMESTLSLERCDPHSFFLDHFSPALLLVVPFYEPIRLAEDLAVLDLVSRGRVSVVAGAGYVPFEFGMFGVDPATRGSRVEEIIGFLNDRQVPVAAR